MLDGREIFVVGCSDLRYNSTVCLISFLLFQSGTGIRFLGKGSFKVFLGDVIFVTWKSENLDL